MNDAAVVWTKPQSEAVRDLLVAAADQQALRLHAVSVDASHVHVLTSWADGRAWAAVRRSLKYSLTRGLNARFGKRDWLSRGGSRKRVKDRAHFTYLVGEYLPRHHAMFWRESDVRRAVVCDAWHRS